MYACVTRHGNKFVDSQLYPVADQNLTGVHTYNIGGHECIKVTRDDAQCWLVYVHGNSVTLDSLHGARIANELTSRAKCNVVAPAYPDKLEDGSKYDDKVAKCVSTVCNTLANDTGAPVYLVGRSLGAAIVLKSCKGMEQQPKGIVCISGFDSARARVPKYLSFLSFLVGDRFDNLQEIASKQLDGVSKLILHGKDDTLIPVSCAHRLHSAASDASVEIIDQMDHTPTASQWSMLFERICRFVDPQPLQGFAAPIYTRWHLNR